MVKWISIGSFAALGVLAWSSSAQAHVSIHPNAVPAGAFATLDVRVPGEQPGAHVSKVEMLLPPGFADVSYEPVPGWRVRVFEGKRSGERQAERVLWTWTGPLGEVGDGQFVQLPLAVAIPAGAADTALEFRTVQTYSNGAVERWIDPALDAEHPSPRIDVTARGGATEDLAGEEAGPAAGQGVPTGEPPRAASPSQRGAGLTIAALALGALGSLAGVLALVRQRRGA
jgi:periplasmic copper chaperone A